VIVALHETVAVPEPVTLFGVIVPQLRPDGEASLRLTIPENPFTDATVIVEVAKEPALTGAGEDAAMVKSWNRNVAVVV
jgi:hypothetical protein